jgi:hypothetical protein
MSQLFGPLLSIAVFTLAGCSAGEFASGSGAAQKVAPKKTVTPDDKSSSSSDGKKDELISDLGGDSSTIPGIQAQKIGVSFEDGSDNDYNDVSVCFDAPFKVGASRPGLPPKVVMAEPKGATVDVYLKSLTGNIPVVTIKVLDKDGKVLFEKQKRYTTGANSNTENPVGPFFNFHFPFGSRLYVQYDWPRGTLNTDAAGKVRVEPNICRNTGR